MLFADRVLLVEGIKDRIVMGSLLEALRSASKVRAVVEVVEVHGKSHFQSYRKLLEPLGVETFVLADLDYAVDLHGRVLGPLLETKWKKVDKDVLSNKKSDDRSTLSQLLDSAIAAGDIEQLRKFWEYVIGRYQRLRSDLTGPEKARATRLFNRLAEKSVFILRRGEIEDYLPVGKRGVDNVLELVRHPNLSSWRRQIRRSSEECFLEVVCGRVLRVDDTSLEAARRVAWSGTSTPDKL